MPEDRGFPGNGKNAGQAAFLKKEREIKRAPGGRNEGGAEKRELRSDTDKEKDRLRQPAFSTREISGQGAEDLHG